MKYCKYLIVSILLVAVIAMLGCTGSQNVTSDQNTSTTSTATPTIKAPAAVSNPTSGSLGFSRKNPASIGTPLTYNFEITNQDSKTGKYSYIKAQERVTILDVKRGYDAVESALSSDRKHFFETYYKTSDTYSGTEPMLVKVKYELVSVDQDLISPWYRNSGSFSLVAGNGTLYSGNSAPHQYFLHSDDGLKEFGFQSYEPSSSEGYILLSVWMDDPAPVIKYVTGDWDSEMWFKTS